MRLHVLTAVTRIENLFAINDSIETANERALKVAVDWHRRYDPQRQYVGGQRLKNNMLDQIRNGWVCILDDDTLMHPNFIRKTAFAISQDPTLEAIVVSQKRTTGVVLQATPENAVVGKIDAGQVLIRRDVIDVWRIPETYAGDGIWLETLLAGAHVQYMPDVLSLHNALSGIDVSETPERMQA